MRVVVCVGCLRTGFGFSSNYDFHFDIHFAQTKLKSLINHGIRFVATRASTVVGWETGKKKKRIRRRVKEIEIDI